ncbi:ABC transporter substrate-binding protein [Metabacillus idriensis]|uniref:ABC transporter substrate-binding protein n=1 Tax=Metabacillus idriensis TaxID=324768 RepID=UPI00174EAA7E|nr:extracellular solute-binding protein [Metabacillus idriensis]
MKKMKALLLCSVSLVLVLSAAGCSSSEGSSGTASNKEKAEIRFSWWGDTKRNEVYNSIVDKFEEKHPNITVKREFGGWNDYWEKLATQTAGGNAPDVVSMHQFYVSEYARKNALLNLNEHVKSGTINLDQFPEAVIESGKLNDKTIMVAKGVTMSGVVFNTALFDKLGHAC